ncbi:MAG: alpha/beta fold hydrolase [Thermaerobacter sp.]|nr:alpha/beta fold hydrolase [Thermaerobacter sp.]
MSPSWRRLRWRNVIIGIAIMFLGLSGYGIYVGWRLTHLPRMKLPTTPAFWGMQYSKVRFFSAVDHLRLHGWFIPAAHKTSLTVIFSHGYGENRADIGVPGLLMMRAVHRWGANILTFDYRAEGRSPGHLVSVGQFEVRDLLGAVKAARTTFAPGTKVAVVGYSMGATIALMAGEADPRVAAIVADSPFAALVPYLQRSLPVWTNLPAFPFDWIILTLVPPLTGTNPALVDPLAHLAALGKRPVLLIAGKADKTVPDANSKLLYARLSRTDPNAVLWLVPGAHHVESFQLRPLQYLARLYAVLHSVDPQLKAPVDFGL